MNKYVIVSCSSRENNQSSKVAATINGLIFETDTEAQIKIIDLEKIKHQEWSNACWGEDIPCDYWRQSSKILAESEGIIFIVPEWHGMIPPSLCNLLILAERNELAHKPALIVSISSGSGGAYPVAQLKGFSSKNNRLCYIPDHVILRHINSKDLTQQNDDHERLLYSLNVLKAYMPALASVRTVVYWIMRVGLMECDMNNEAENYKNILTRAFNHHYNSETDVWTQDIGMRILPLLVKGKLRFGPETRLLDIGCGSGLDVGVYSPQCLSVEGVDLFAHPEWPKSAAVFENVEFKHGDFLNQALKGDYHIIADNGCFPSSTAIRLTRIPC